MLREFEIDELYEVIRLAAIHKDRTEIARFLKISPKTFSDHLRKNADLREAFNRGRRRGNFPTFQERGPKH